MRIECPKCRMDVPAANISLDEGQAQCEGCHETFSLAKGIVGYPAQQKPPVGHERPADALTRVSRMSGRLEVSQPAQGFRNQSCGKYLCWLILPLASDPFWIAFMLEFARPDGHWDLSALLFLVAFYIARCFFACYMLGALVWLSSAERSICCDSRRMDMELRCWLWRRRCSVSRDDVEGARPRTMPANEKENLGNMDCTHAVQIVYEGGLFNLPCKHAAEQAWLVDEINEFLTS